MITEKLKSKLMTLHSFFSQFIGMEICNVESQRKWLILDCKIDWAKRTIMYRDGKNKQTRWKCVADCNGNTLKLPEYQYTPIYPDTLNLFLKAGDNGDGDDSINYVKKLFRIKACEVIDCENMFDLNIHSLFSSSDEANHLIALSIIKGFVDKNFGGNQKLIVDMAANYMLELGILDVEWGVDEYQINILNSGEDWELIKSKNKKFGCISLTVGVNWYVNESWQFNLLNDKNNEPTTKFEIVSYNRVATWGIICLNDLPMSFSRSETIHNPQRVIRKYLKSLLRKLYSKESPYFK